MDSEGKGSELEGARADELNGSVFWRGRGESWYAKRVACREREGEGGEKGVEREGEAELRE